MKYLLTFKAGKDSVSVVLTDNGAKVMIEYADATTDWPIRYPEGGYGFDYQHRITTKIRDVLPDAFEFAEGYNTGFHIDYWMQYGHKKFVAAMRKRDVEMSYHDRYHTFAIAMKYGEWVIREGGATIDIDKLADRYASTLS